jgi:hypothetical protein
MKFESYTNSKNCNTLRKIIKNNKSITRKLQGYTGKIDLRDGQIW